MQIAAPSQEFLILSARAGPGICILCSARSPSNVDGPQITL